MQRLDGVHGYLLVERVTGQSGEGAEFQQEGADAGGAGDAGLAFRHAVLEIHRAVRHPRGRIERGDQSLGHVLGEAQQRAVAGPAGLELDAGLARQQMGAQQAADHPDIRLEHRHVDVRLEVRPRADQLGDAAELGEVAHDRERVQGVDQGQGEAAPRVEAVAAQRAQLVVRIGVRQVTGIRVVEHGPYLLPQSQQISPPVLPEPADQDEEAEHRARPEENHRCRLTGSVSLLSVITARPRLSLDVTRCGRTLEMNPEHPALAT